MRSAQQCVRTRVFVCPGSVQLVAAIVASAADGAVALSHDVLVLHDLWSDEFARCIEEMAARLSRWARVVHLESGELEALAREGRVRGLGAALAQLRARLGVEHADEVYLGQSPWLTPRLVAAAFPGARRTSYGDGIGLNFSEAYFTPEAPRVRRRDRVRERMRAAWRSPAQPPSWEPPPAVFHRHALLLPNQFDQVVSDVVLSDPGAFRAAFEVLGPLLDSPEGHGLVPGRRTELGTLPLTTHVSVVLTSNFSESGKMSADAELRCYGAVLKDEPVDSDTVLVLKPHPRDSKEKVAAVVRELAPRFSQVIQLDDPLSFHLPFEVIFERYLRRRGPGRVRVTCFSSACLSLELLYGATCRVGFGEELVRASFARPWVEHRLRHEADLARVIQVIRAARAAGSTP